MKFEDRITESAQRMTAKQNAELHVPGNPLKQSHHYWGWIATPAAAIVGIVFGLSYQHFTKKPDNLLAQAVDTVLVPQVQHDTVLVPQVQHDTLWLTRVEEKERVVEKTVSKERRPSRVETRDELPIVSSKIENEDSVCTSVSCDGINYSILASN